MSTNETISLAAPLDELLDYASQRFEVAFEPVSAGGHTLQVLQITNMIEYVERIASHAGRDGIELPFWAKIWPSSVILAHMIGTLPKTDNATLLEIGAGVGVCGLAAGAYGFESVITDINPDALIFSQINILQNGLSDRVKVQRADFSEDRLGKRFNYIIGAEVLYIEKLHRGLAKFLNAHIKHEAEAQILISRDHKRKAMRFFKLIQQDFHQASKTIGCKTTEDGDTERFLCDVIRMTPRKLAG
ncbi:class I SAM-dependent methyltransferase [Desulfovibrio ferrophilus]|uniref:Methyltransferase small n=1 Tax=Desulfovibrio ferrophilus TaxID=241368 RepID=A0A2Z6AUW9_9BACT|nr:protein N-lysine methyltransferase family protein [Desulfovibrio ferrophilus]BBD06976.1 methyltransferase small [Desulfovibrio ferrophilus]